MRYSTCRINLCKVSLVFTPVIVAVDVVFNQIKIMNENLQKIMKEIDFLCKLLPDDLKMEDSIPIPLLALESHSEVYVVGISINNAIGTSRKASHLFQSGSNSQYKRNCLVPCNWK